ncbi:MAG TPA: hypothetical protein VL859_09180 [Flavobacterium sp.]|nr:hypothetical protein [Flavobacterium sp.]
MENQQVKKYIKIFGRLITFIFLLSCFCRMFLRDYYSRENHDFVVLVFLGFAVVHLILRLIFDKESVVDSLKSVFYQIKKHLPELLIVGLFFLLWFMYKRS